MPSTHPIDLSLYLVLDPVLCSGEDGMIETARAACAGGATVVQLRAPGWKKRQLVECGRALKTVLAPYHVPLIVDDDADVCLAVNADGLHVGQRDLTPEDARAIIGGDRILGLSVTTLAELTAQNPKFSGIPVVRSRNVYNNNRRQTPARGSDFWESGVVRPDLVLRDLRTIFLGDSVPTCYYKRLE